jgi:hypothetical protein
MGLNFPITLTQNTVVGRSSLGTGNAEEIPFAQLATALGVGSTFQVATSIAGTNTITGVTVAAAPLAANQVIFFTPVNSNTGATTFNRDALGAKAVLYNGVACVGGELVANVPAALFYDGTQYHILTNTTAAAIVAVQNGSYVLLSSVAGTNTITGSVTPAITAYVSGQMFILKPANTNTGATTLNVNNLGAKNVFKNGAACIGGELAQNVPALVEYDGTQFNIVGTLYITILTEDTTPDQDADYAVTHDTSAGGQKKVLLKNMKRMSPITSSMVTDVALTNVTTYADGPSVSQGTTGIWFASGFVTLEDTAGAAQFAVKLHDGSTVIASGQGTSGAANQPVEIGLSGFITSPAGNLRISVKDISSTSGQIRSNKSGNSKDSTITAIRIG